MTCDSPESVIQGTFRSPFLRQIVHKLVLGSQVVHNRHLVAGTVHSLMQMESTRSDIRTEQVDISQGCQSTRNTKSDLKNHIAAESRGWLESGSLQRPVSQFDLHYCYTCRLQCHGGWYVVLSFWLGWNDLCWSEINGLASVVWNCAQLECDRT